MTNTFAPTQARVAAAGVVAALAAALTFAAVGPAAAAAPTSTPDSYSVVADTPLTVANPGVFANDSDPDGDPLAFHSLWPPAGGTIGDESLAPTLGGGFTYTPPAGFTGTRVFQYRAQDATEVSELTDITFTISAPVVATAPVAVADAFDVIPGTPLVVPAPGLYANDSDADGDSWSYKSLMQPVLNALPGETLDINAGQGAFTYTPPTGFTGVRVWQYAIQGDDGESALVDITFTIAALAGPNTAPVAASDGYSATAGVSLILTAPGVLDNDTDADADPLEVSTWSAPAGGLLAGEDFGLNPNGSFEYLAPAGYTGTREFSYRVSDGTAESADAVITFTVTAAPVPNAAPVGMPDAYAVMQDTERTVAAPGVLANDTDADGDPLVVGQVFGPAGGALLGEALTVAADGSFVYNPPTGFVGTRTWRYEANDGIDPADQAAIEFTISAAGGSTPVEPVEPAEPAEPAEPTEPTEPDLSTNSHDPADGGTVLAATGSTLPYTAGILAALVAATGFVLVRSSRREA